jgi:hypothetical protein
MVQPMIGRRQNRRQLEHADPTQAEAHPIAVGEKVLGQQQWDVIDTFTSDGKYLGHTESLPQCSKLPSI